MRSRCGVRGCPRTLAACRGGRLRNLGAEPCGSLPGPRTLSSSRRPGMRFTGSSGPLPASLRKRVSLAPSAPLVLPCGSAVARWGEKSERSRGYGLSSRPPDVHLRACAQKLVFEDPRSDRARRRKAHANTTLLTFDAVLPDTYRSVGPVDCSPGLPLLGFVQRSPLRRSSLRSPLPEHPCGCPFGTRLPRPVRVPSSWFLTTSTACSFEDLRVYCNALPTLGFTPFRCLLRRLPCSAGLSSRCLPCPPKLSLRW